MNEGKAHESPRNAVIPSSPRMRAQWAVAGDLFGFLPSSIKSALIMRHFLIFISIYTDSFLDITNDYNKELFFITRTATEVMLVFDSLSSAQVFQPALVWRDARYRLICNCFLTYRFIEIFIIRSFACTYRVIY